MRNIEIEVATLILREAEVRRSTTEDIISYTIDVAVSVLASFVASATTVGATSVPNEQFIQEVADILVNKIHTMLEGHDAKNSD